MYLEKLYAYVIQCHVHHFIDISIYIDFSHSYF